jgi:prevent-host-death family protein
MTTVSLTEARRRWSELVEAAERGESVIITKRGRPVARLGPIPPQGGRPLPDLADFRATIRARGKPLSETVVELRGSNRF